MLPKGGAGSGDQCLCFIFTPGSFGSPGVSLFMLLWRTRFKLKFDLTWRGPPMLFLDFWDFSCFSSGAFVQKFWSNGPMGPEEL